jgi:Ca-activated chloride channel family protein
MPLTSDFAVAKLYVTNASPDAISLQGTVVGDALRLCENSLNTKEKKYKAVILISDGEDHDPHSTEILKQLADNGVGSKYGRRGERCRCTYNGARHQYL